MSCTGTGKGRCRIGEQYGSRPCPIWMLMVGGGSGGKEINNGLKRSTEDSRNKHQSGNVREPHNRVDLKLTNGLKRTKAVQERSCGPAVQRREHGGVGRLRRRRTIGGLLRRRTLPTAPRFRPSQTLRCLHERKRKTKKRRNEGGAAGKSPTRRERKEAGVAMAQRRRCGSRRPTRRGQRAARRPRDQSTACVVRPLPGTCRSASVRVLSRLPLHCG